MTNTILVVDDAPDNVKVLRHILKQAGFKVLVAQNGLQGLERAESTQPDLILLDVVMPHVDGFEVCRRLKEKELTREIPIIFITVLAEISDKIRGLDLGAVDYITKPFYEQEVLARVTTHLKLRQQQQQLQKELKARRECTMRLEKLNLELDTFARMVAHNLKVPLSEMIGYTDLLLEQLETSLDEESVGFLHHVYQTGQKMADMVDALLLFAKTKVEQVPVEALNMSWIIQSVLQNRVFRMVKESQAEIILPETWLTAYGHSSWVEEIWANYLSNALKYGGHPPRLVLGSTLQEDGKACFWIRDNGEGLTLEQQKRLFIPFMRLYKKDTEGHGLGLSIVRQIAEKLGGTAGVESTPGQGSTFYFILPAFRNEQK